MPVDEQQADKERYIKRIERDLQKATEEDNELKDKLAALQKEANAAGGRKAKLQAAQRRLSQQQSTAEDVDLFEAHAKRIPGVRLCSCTSARAHSHVHFPDILLIYIYQALPMYL